MINPSFFDAKKVMVTGGTGLIGTNMINQLLHSGAKITAIIHKTKPYINNKKINYIKADLTKYDECLKITKNQDYIIHCAAASFGIEIMSKDPKRLVTSNILMNTNLLDAAHTNKVERFLFISSSTIYPPSNMEIPEEYDKNKEPFPLYLGVGGTKRMGEYLCDFYRKTYGMKICILRPVNTYGPFDKFGEGSHVLPALIKRAEKENPLNVWGDGETVRDFIYIDDFIDQALLALEKKADCDPLNIGTGIAQPLRQIIPLIMKAWNKKEYEIKYDNSKPNANPYVILSIGKSRNSLGITPGITLEEGTKRTVEWYKKNKGKIRR